jgi:hypothetical protein
MVRTRITRNPRDPNATLPCGPGFDEHGTCTRAGASGCRQEPDHARFARILLRSSMMPEHITRHTAGADVASLLAHRLSGNELAPYDFD